jgi:hypothetical protein
MFPNLATMLSHFYKLILSFRQMDGYVSVSYLDLIFAGLSGYTLIAGSAIIVPAGKNIIGLLIFGLHLIFVGLALSHAIIISDWHFIIGIMAWSFGAGIAVIQTFGETFAV